MDGSVEAVEVHLYFARGWSTKKDGGGKVKANHLQEKATVREK